MKIISLRFANLNSLPGPYLIRFDASPLADTGLFAITGPTGAGKSTLLDAIAVGLYGRVPRHDRQVGEMVSRHAPGAWAEVEFEVHHTSADTGQTTRARYRSRWEVRRKTRGDDKGGLGQDAMTLTDCATGQTFLSGKELVPARVSELSGLDFGQFEQAVLLSQGKFARFLHAPEKERSALLEKMTNVGIYSQLSVAAFEKAKQEEQQTKLLEAALHATRLLSDDERRQLETQLDELHQETELAWEHQQQLSDCLAWRTILDQLSRQLGEVQHETATLQRADETLQPEFARLAGHQRASARELATPLALAAAAQQAIERDDAQLRHLKNTLPTLALAADEAAAALAAATAAHHTAQAEENHQRPLLEEVRLQDAALATAKQQLYQKEAAHFDAQLAQQEAEATHQHQAQELHHLAAAHTTLDDWLLEHQHEAELKEQLRALDREIIDLQGAQREIATREAQQQEILKTQGVTAADLARQQQAAAAALARQQALEQARAPHQRAREALLAGTSPAELAQQAEALTTHLQGLQQLLPKAEAAHDHHARAEALEAQLTQAAPALAAAEAAVAHCEAQLRTGQQLLDSLRRELRLQQALADLNAHRQYLRPGQPCPLCGATTHALAPDFQAEAEAPERQVAAQQQALTALAAELRTLTQDLTRRQTEQQQRQQQQHEAAAAAQVATQQAQALAAALHPSPPQPASPAAVRQLLAAATAAHEAATARRRQLGQLDDQLAELRETHLAAGTAALAAQAEVRLLEQRRTSAGLELQQLAAGLAHWREQASIYEATIRAVLQPHQLALPARPPYDGLLATLEGRALAYESQRAALAAGQQQLLERRAAHQAQAPVLAAGRRQLLAAAEALAAEQQALAQQQADRRARYDSADPAAAAAQLRQRTQQLAEAAQHAQQLHAQQQQALAVQQNAHAVLETQLADQHLALAAHQEALAAAFAAAGFASAAEAQALLLPTAEAERLHQRQQAHRTALAAATRRQADLGAEHQRHAEFALTPLGTAELAAQASALAAADDMLQQKLGAVSNQLSQDDAARARLAEGHRALLLRQQEQQRWQDLAEQIGSAKGDKFSQFAQGLTLSHLARLANLRLRQLTSRYTILKTPNRNLELQIIDHDQADTVRPMASLSGGESFLVSLALALGLSELAGYKARIESLFIDEGFGSLDPDALNTALDALERLQHSGKMIGVISHVADLKERIGTQIRVQPLAGGNSTVRVVDVAGNEQDCAE